MAETKKWNVIVLDWAPLSNSAYAESLSHAKLVAKHLKEFTLFLIKAQSLLFHDIHYIGHSLGAHIAAIAAYQIKNKTDATIGRITGLDPAAPMFEWPDEAPIEERLDEDDAVFVDVIHTNIEVLGVKKPCGYVDYFPNGGKSQPGCGSCKLFNCILIFIRIFKANQLIKCIFQLYAVI